MLLIAVRHGEAEWNVEHREMGQLDSPLTALGIQQAEAIARRLRGIKVDVLYSSDLGRAVQTAEIIAGLCQKNIRLDSGLRERHMGLLQGLTVPEMREKYAEVREHYDQYGYYDRVPEGEDAQQMLERSTRVLRSIAERHPGETVVVVTHSGVLRSLFESTLCGQGSNGQCYKRQNASFNSFEYMNSRWCLETWNDTSHLGRT